MGKKGVGCSGEVQFVSCAFRNGWHHSRPGSCSFSPARAAALPRAKACSETGSKRVPEEMHPAEVVPRPVETLRARVGWRKQGERATQAAACPVQGARPPVEARRTRAAPPTAERTPEARPTVAARSTTVERTPG